MNETKKAERPKGSVGSYKERKKDAQIAFRVTKEEKEIIKNNAISCGLSLSEYLLKVVLS